MKKWLSILLAVSILVGCSAETGQNKQQAQTTIQGTNETSSNYQSFDATVVKVTDGDTLTIKRNEKKEKIRLLLVDTPESVKEGVDPQPFSIEASNFVKQLLPEGTKVTVEPGVKGHEYDKYNRMLAYVYVNGEMLNKTLIREGFARVGFIYEPNTRYLDEFLKIQEQAKKEKKNIWSINGYVTSKGYDVSAVSSSKQNNTNYSTNIQSEKGKIKGNANSKINHLPEGKYYNTEMKNVEWFNTIEEADKAGYRASKE